ncbi:cartilage matrix protein [Lingula anatina]|uniref:Cartilage matrix protein n=1 Tax=Lingula anatina TaxID=7574 RepID=A0A1S3HXJ7_LINAN|nr:cartilage matrix protein [Lingula anatina]|eukprot:XP_013390757.1 cartilage matrix protein [Lingula anatina]
MDLRHIVLAVAAVCSMASAASVSKRAEEKICGKPSDIIFVIDASSSIWPPHFTKQLKFIQNVVDQFNVKDDGSGTRIGAVVFSNAELTRVAFDLNDHFGKAALRKAIEGIKQMGGNTYTDTALEMVRTKLLNKAAGARMHSEVPQIVIVMTDGVSQDPPETARQAQLIKDIKGVKIISLGIGLKVNMGEIMDLASEPKDHNAFTVNSYDGLESIKKELAIEACPEVLPPCDVTTNCGINKTADVAFVLGETVTRSGVSTGRALDFVKNVTADMHIGPNEIRVAMVPKECNTPGYHFNEYSTYESMVGHMDKYKKIEQTTAARLRYMTRETFSVRNGARAGVRKIAVVIVDGKSENRPAIYAAAKAAKQAGVELIAIGVGDNIEPKELGIIATSRRHVIRLQDYSQLRGQLRRLFYRVVCKGGVDPDPDDRCDKEEEEEEDNNALPSGFSNFRGNIPPGYPY